MVWKNKKKSVCGPQSKCKHQIAAVEPDLPRALVDITRSDSLLHLAPSGGVSKDRMLAGWHSNMDYAVPMWEPQPAGCLPPARWPSRVAGALTTQLYVIRPHREPADGTKGIIEEEKTRGEMPAESPSPPLSRTENTALPLCSELLSPGPQPFWREGKSSCFLSPSLTTWHSSEKASAAVF